MGSPRPGAAAEGTGAADLGLAGLAGLALALAAALPGEKFHLDWLGASPGSLTRGVAFYAAEVAAWILGLLTLLWPGARRRIPPGASLLAGLWCLALAWGAWQGWRQGAAPRDILAEARAALLAPALLGLVALSPRGWTLALCAASFGLVLGFSLEALLLLLEPTGRANLSVVPVPVLMVEHNLPWILLLALGSLALLLRQALSPRGLRAYGLLLLWAFFWLSFLRSLWAALALGTAAAAAGLLLGRQAGAALRLLAWQAGLALAGLGLALLLQRAATPDGDYLLRFRLSRLAQALHLAQPPPPSPRLGPPNSALLRGLAAKGGLYRNLRGPASEPSAEAQRARDPSQEDRGMMRRLSWQAYLSHPLAGAGLGSLIRYSYLPGMDRVQRDPHQGYAWLLKCGALGLLAGAALLLLPLGRACAAARRREGWGASWALAGLATLAAAELFHVGWLQVPGLLAWALAAAAALREPAS